MNLCRSLFFLGLATIGLSAAEHPNIVLILADDLGYGDVSCYGASAIKTPHLDALAAAGRRFTDAHATSATCTPSRYAILTGEYPWRRPNIDILAGDAPLIISQQGTTLPRQLQRSGYATAAVGKWHLGLGVGKVDWNAEIAPGPCEIGFDTCFLIPATGDRVPCVFVRDHRVVNLDPADPLRVSYDAPIDKEAPTAANHPEMLRYIGGAPHDKTIINGVGRIGYMSGGQKARWDDEKIAETLAREATKFIHEHRAEPFFLYFATHDIHVPHFPAPAFAGASGLGLRGDAILQFDWTVGQVLTQLEEDGLRQSTIVIVTSDNGPVVDDGYRDGSAGKLGGHQPAGIFRGGKYSALEGGTRVPWIVRWPGKIKPGVSDAVVSQVDFLATLSNITGAPVPVEATLDSRDESSSWFGSDPRGRDVIIEEGRTNQLTVVKDGWKYIAASDGKMKPVLPNGIETGASRDPQLYHLNEDPREARNVATKFPEKLAELQRLLAASRLAAPPKT